MPILARGDGRSARHLEKILLDLNGRGSNGNDEGDELADLRRRRRELLDERRRRFRFDLSEAERPEFDRSQSRLNKIVTGAGAVGALVGALGGSEVGAAAGAGLARGGAQNLARQRESFRRRRKAFREQLQSKRRFNRELGLSTNEAQLESLDREIEAERRRNLARFKQQLEEKMTPQEKKKFHRELDLLDARIGAQEALATERRTGAEANEALAERRRREEDEESDEPTKEDLEQQLVSNSRAMSELSRLWAGVQQKLEGGNLVEANREELQKRAAGLQEQIDELAVENARVRARIENRRGSSAPAGEPSRTRRQEAPQDGSPDAQGREVQGVLEEVRRIQRDSTSAAALRHLRQLIRSERIDRPTANAVLDSLGIQ